MCKTAQKRSHCQSHSLFVTALSASNSRMFFFRPTVAIGHVHCSCILTRDNPLWYNSVMPEKGVSVHVDGLCSHVLRSGVLAININKMLFHFGYEHIPSRIPCPRYTFASKLIPDWDDVTETDAQDHSEA